MKPATVLAIAVQAAALLLPGMVRAQAVALPTAAVAAARPADGWHFATLPNKAPTVFSVAEMGGKPVLKVEADRSYGNIVRPVQVTVDAGTTLSWRWRVDELLADADLRKRSGDDSPAKLCVFFGFPSDKLSVGERAQLALARSSSGEDLPTEALCYVWDNKLPRDTALQNAFTNRVRMIVLESGSARLGQWIDERRDLRADYERAFGDEAGGTVPQAVALAISADADNTGGHAVSYFSDLRLQPGHLPGNAPGNAPRVAATATETP